MLSDSRAVVGFWIYLVTRAAKETWSIISLRRALLSALAGVILAVATRGVSGFDDYVTAAVFGLGGYIVIFVAVFGARFLATPWRVARELGWGATPGVFPWYEEQHPVCCVRWTNSGNDDPFSTARFRLGLVNNTGALIENVRATCGETKPPSSLVGSFFHTYPDETETFRIPRSVADKPSVFLDVAFTQVVDHRRAMVAGAPGDVWVQYTLGPVDGGKRYLSGPYVTLHTSKAPPRFEFVVRLECPTQTYEIPCVMWLDGVTNQFKVLGADDIRVVPDVAAGPPEVGSRPASPG